LSLRWRYGLALLLGLIGLGLNALPVYVLTRDTPAFAFGGAAVLLSFVSLGTGPGLLSALVSVVPFLATADALGLASLIALLEAWAATLLYRQFGSLVFTVAAFWFTVGWLIDLAAYGGLAGLPLDLLTLVFIKQLFSGILNALVAEGFATWEPNPRHRRAKLLRASPTAYAAIGRIAAVQHPWSSDLGAAVGDRRIARATETVQALLDALDEPRHRPAP